MLSVTVFLAEQGNLTKNFVIFLMGNFFGNLLLSTEELQIKPFFLT